MNNIPHKIERKLHLSNILIFPLLGSNKKYLPLQGRICYRHHGEINKVKKTITHSTFINNDYVSKEYNILFLGFFFVCQTIMEK